MILNVYGWGEVEAALLAFFASHIITARPAVKRPLVSALGAKGYALLYSALSALILVWLIAAAGRAPFVQLWDFKPWQLWVPTLVMPFACMLFVFGLSAKNPFSLAATNNATFDPARPGIAGITRHPLLWAITLWAASHMIPNGDLAHVLVFGLFAVFGLMGMAALDRRLQKKWGPERWRALAAHTSFLPFAAAFRAGTFMPSWLDFSPVRLFVVVALYFLLILLHPVVIGGSPLPPL